MAPERPHAPSPVRSGPPRPGLRPVLVGGVGYRWQSDSSFGLVAVDALAERHWPAGTDIRDLGYGAIYAAQDIAAVVPRYRKAIFIAGVSRGRPPGRLYPWRWVERKLDPEEVQERIREAGAGVIHLDHLLAVAEYFGALPSDVVILEAEPVVAGPGQELSPRMRGILPEVLQRVRGEVAEVVGNLPGVGGFPGAYDPGMAPDPAGADAATRAAWNPAPPGGGRASWDLEEG